MKQILLSALFALSLAVPFLAPSKASAQAKTGIDYAMVNEIQDEKSKTYTLEIEFWSVDRPAEQFTVTPRTDEGGLKILTKKKVWKGPIKKGHKIKQSITAKNSTQETRPLYVDITRKAGGRSDTKTISVMVAPN